MRQCNVLFYNIWRYSILVNVNHLISWAPFTIACCHSGLHYKIHTLILPTFIYTYTHIKKYTHKRIAHAQKLTRMTTFIKTKFKILDDQTNIDNYGSAENPTMKMSLDFFNWISYFENKIYLLNYEYFIKFDTLSMS